MSLSGKKVKNKKREIDLYTNSMRQVNVCVTFTWKKVVYERKITVLIAGLLNSTALYNVKQYLFNI